MNKSAEIREYVAAKINCLLRTSETSGGKAELANLRRGVGKAPGELPALWGSFLLNLPEELTSSGGEPSKAEWAIYTAITMFALHQQGQSAPMNKSGTRLGQAVRALVKSDEDEQRILRRFNVMATSTDMKALSYQLRRIIDLLKDNGIPLDYAELASDLYSYQFEGGAANVRLRWGQDFYRKGKEEE